MCGWSDEEFRRQHGDAWRRGKERDCRGCLNRRRDVGSARKSKKNCIRSQAQLDWRRRQNDGKSRKLAGDSNL
jgi:hypothetical protein